jgi:hypothetical protein
MEIEKYRHDLEVIRNTALQVAKDFELYGIEIALPADETHAYESLKAQMIPVIEQWMSQNPERLGQLLYRIDVNEKEYAAAPDASILAHLILERELIKVITRKLMSEH